MKGIEKAAYYSLIILALLVLINRLALVNSYSFDLSGFEFYFNFLALKLEGGELYKDPEAFPFLITQYTPLYLYILNGTSGLAGLIGLDEVRGLYVFGRSINLVFNLLTVFILFRFFRIQLKTNLQVAVAVSLMSFILFTAHHYAVRPDSLKILFVVLLYRQAHLFLTEKGYWHLFLMILWSFLAVFTKQDALIHVLIIGGLVLVNGRYSAFLSYSLGSITICAFAILLLFDFDVYNMYQNLVIGISQGSSVPWFWLAIKRNIFSFMAIILGLSFIFAANRRYALLRTGVAALLLFYVIFLVFALSKWGSHFHYFMELEMAILVILSFTAIRSSRKVSMVPALLFTLLVFSNNIWAGNIRIGENLLGNSLRSNYIQQKDQAQKVEETMTDISEYYLISFSKSLPLFLSDRIVLGTTINEYPELFLPDLEQFTSSLPSRTYQYNFPCGTDIEGKIFYLKAHSSDPVEEVILKEMFLSSANLKMELYKRKNRFRVYRVLCE